MYAINLVEINLSNNRISSFAWPRFACLKHLQYIDLSYNVIVYLDGTFYEYLTELKKKWNDLIRDEAMNQKHGRCNIETRQLFESSED